MKKILLLTFITYSSFAFSQAFDGNLGSNTLRWATEQKDFNSLPRVGVIPMSLRLWDNYNGTNAPTPYGTLLEIYGKVGHLVSQMYFNNNWNGGQIMYRSAFYNQNTWGEWRNLLDSKSNVASSGNLIIEGTGNSGIGTNNPEKKFQINASNTDAGLRIHADNGNNNTNTPYLLLTGGYIANNGVALRGVGDLNYGKKALVFYSGWEGNIDNPAITDLQERMRISSNGNVGIGTTTTGTHKLAVEGSIGAREIKVMASGWSDFVFKKEYNLPTLTEVEKHIAEKGHLKDIPSEEDVLKNGINLGEMNSKLLQKIEELTLYSIQQNKKIEEQSKEIESLKSLALRIAKLENQSAQK
ncbi:pyocin knob domain-containing protein [Flavobacterium sp. H4147]|uniref:pyocin knob domain-containing protein n=1 Tax=Flavobacterium sp. H4147 TaxID=3034149 RepID=UPI0023EDDAAB|nr:pyocin knob domain-containing protein [Flavobacterium sp. H4147]